ncbi:hypothetical protein [Methanoregula sp.]|uniref:hypothetical protein n=1 Tax=Methanoregula sp. TaxID=2052170 RepID=UPI003BB12737
MAQSEDEENYYPTWEEANANRSVGEKIYRKPNVGYYIVKPRKAELSAVCH